MERKADPSAGWAGATIPFLYLATNPERGNQSRVSDHGAFDMLAVLEVPTDVTLAAYVLWLGSQGNIRTQTMKAWRSIERLSVS